MPRVGARAAEISQIKAVRAPVVSTASCECEECKNGQACSCQLQDHAPIQRYTRSLTRDFRTALNDALAVYDLAYALKLLLPAQTYVVDVYNSYFVYEAYISDMGFRFYKNTYKVSSDGKVTIGNSPQMVRPVTQYTEVENPVRPASIAAAQGQEQPNTTEGELAVSYTHLTLPTNREV